MSVGAMCHTLGRLSSRRSKGVLAGLYPCARHAVGDTDWCAPRFKQRRQSSSEAGEAELELLEYIDMLIIIAKQRKGDDASEPLHDLLELIAAASDTTFD